MIDAGFRRRISDFIWRFSAFIMKDYYQILGVDRKASKEEIKKAYHALAHRHHPDKGGDEAKFKEINEAYQVLSNDEKRSQYDQFGRTFENASGTQGGFDFGNFSQWFGQGGQQGQNFNFDWQDGGGLGDIFSEFFGGSAEGSGRSRRRKGADVAIDVTLNLEDILFGLKKEIQLQKFIRCDHCRGTGVEPGSDFTTCSACNGRGKTERIRQTILGSFREVRTCQACNGEGKIPEKHCASCRGEGRKKEIDRFSVEIPAGIEDGQVVKLEGKGEAGKFQERAGDLYITIHIRPHPIFERKGANLILEKEINFTQAALGDKIEVPTLEQSVMLKIPEGIQSGQIITIDGKGLPYFGQKRRGNIFVSINVKTPKRLSRRGKELLEELKKEL